MLYMPSVRDSDGSTMDNGCIKTFENAKNWFDIEQGHDQITQQPVVYEHGQKAPQPVIGEHGQKMQQPVTGEHCQKMQQQVIGKHGQKMQQPVDCELGQNMQHQVVHGHGQNPTVLGNSSTKTLGFSETFTCKAGNEQESICIKTLIYKLWCPKLVGIGKDAHSHLHSRINIKTIHHVHSQDVWQRYIKKKKDILNSVTDNRIDRLFCPEDFGADIKPVKTDDALKLIPENNLETNVDRKINEHYLFHGTNISNIHSIIQKGFDKNTCHRKMLGKGIYFTDHPVKADQYTGEFSWFLNHSHLACSLYELQQTKVKVFLTFKTFFEHSRHLVG